MLRMEVLNWKTRNCHTILALASVIIVFRGVACQENAITPDPLDVTKESLPILKAAHVRGDDIPPAGTHNPQMPVGYPSLTDAPHTVDEEQTTETTESSTVAEPKDQHDTQSPQHIITEQPAAEASVAHTSKVVCVDEAAVRDKDAVKLKLKIASSCEENKAKIQSVLEHLCGDGSKLEIYQQDHTDEMIISGECVQGDAKGMTEKFENDNIKDKVGVVETEPVLVNHSRAVFISVLLAGLLLAALLVTAYILKTRRSQAKGMRLADELFQVDEQNQGNTLLSVAPLPPQEPVEKPTSNGESLDSPPTNGHSASQTPVADTEM